MVSQCMKGNTGIGDFKVNNNVFFYMGLSNRNVSLKGCFCLFEGLILSV